MLVPPHDQIHRLEMLDLSVHTRHVSVSVDWFRAIYDQEVPNTQWHEHSCIEIHFVVDGEVQVHFHDCCLSVAAGQAIYIPGGVSHRLENVSGQPYYRYVLAFEVKPLTGDQEAAFLAETLRIQQVRVMPISAQVLELLGQCMSESIERMKGFLTMVELHVLALLIAVARELTHSVRANYPVPEKLHSDERRMREINRLLDADEPGITTVRDLAQRMYLSSRQVQRIVQRHAGVSAQELVARARLRRAKELLKDNDLTISEIAWRMGFASQQSFSRFFRKMEGDTPARYRRGALAQRITTSGGGRRKKQAGGE